MWSFVVFYSLDTLQKGIFTESRKNEQAVVHVIPALLVITFYLLSTSYTAMFHLCRSPVAFCLSVRSKTYRVKKC